MFGNPHDFLLHGDGRASVVRNLIIMYRPCIPRQRTTENKDREKCLVNDVSNKEELDAMLAKSINYVGEAQIDLLYNQ